MTSPVEPAGTSLDTLVGKYRAIFTSLEGKRDIPVNPFILCLDAEWHEVGGKNRVLSYQVATLTRTAASNVIGYMDSDHRLSLAEVVEAGIRSVNGGQIPESCRTNPNLVHLVAHHVTAEWSVLRDRMEPHILKNLTVIRKSPVTGRELIPVEIGGGVRCYVQIVDSRLLAPAGFQSLKKLSMLLGSDNDLKHDIPYYWKKRMHEFRRREPQKFEAYSLQDTAVTLKVYLLLLDCLIKLSGKDGKRGRAKIFRTLASGAVTGFLRSYPAFGMYVKRMRAPEYTEVMRLFRRGYHGGRNEGYLLGRTDRIAALDGRLWTDVDFCGCYPSAMALCPTVANGIDPMAQPSCFPPDVQGDPWQKIFLAYGPQLPVRYHPQVYRLKDRSDEAILKEGIASSNYHRVKRIIDELNAITDELPPDQAANMEEGRRQEIAADIYRQRMAKLKEFDAELARIRLGGERADEAEAGDVEALRLKGTKSGRVQARRIRELAVKIDNTLVRDWFRRWRLARRAGDPSIERSLVAGVAKVKFRFPPRTQYPCLPVPHPAYGLVFPLEGECVATAIEIVTAMAAGARIKALCSVELPVLHDLETGQVQRPFFDHLQMLVKLRNDFKDDMKDEKLPAEVRQRARVLEQLTKECSNSFYGKTAQSIRYRRAYGPGTGEMKSLGPSQITEACAGALTTGLARAALGAVLLAIERYNRQQPPARRILVASATTDGLLVGLPRPSEEFRTADCYQWGDDEGNRETADLQKRLAERVAGNEERPKKGEQVKGLGLRKKYTKIETILELCKCQGLMDEMMKFLPIRQMRNARRELTNDATFLEVKNLADHAAFVKTRGQLGWIDYQSYRRPFYKDGRAFTIAAKFGLKPPLTDIVAEGIDVTTLPQWKVMRLEQRYARLQDGPDTDRNTVEGTWVLQQLDRVRDADQQAMPINTYPFYTLTGFNEIVKNEEDELDLTQKVTDRAMNCDYDWKRRLALDDNGGVSPFSAPYLNITQMLAHRGQMQAERRWGRNALPEAVLHRVQMQGRRTSARGGDAAVVTRLFLRLMVAKKHLPGARLGRRVPDRLNRIWTSLGLSMQAMTPKKNGKNGEGADVARPPKAGWTSDDVKNARRSKILELRIIRPTPTLINLVDALAKEFKVDADLLKALLFSDPLDEELNPALASMVARAVLQGPRLRLEPFRTLYVEGKLPNKAMMVQVFHPHLTTGMVEACTQGDFHPGEGAGWDRPRLARLFRRLGLGATEADHCAKVLVLPGSSKKKLPANPARQRCLECFVHALHQRDIVPRSIGAMEALDKLKPFGLKRHRFFALRHDKFAPRCLSDTAGNRRQINRMACLLRLDPEPLLEALLDK